ncbi:MULTISPECIES: aKG-HExxH-type peptide beta-hydroxylase [Streptomyces]|uniref:HEXXH motif-containing protein n=1 Tax=Streptomyces griseoviridis TaxID=45398 RepID=A0ABT9LK07_STRGD|nr:MULTISPECIES: HEXXH motif-containing putative peptide modification protein [Streptomyces]MDP9684042.1 HEXXH motif-containing protein [Streptomyces griseoviridis]
MFPTVPDRVLTGLARTEGGPDALDLLVRDQDTRRLLVLRAVLDAAEAAGPAVCDAGRKARLRDDWALLAEADRAASPGAGEAGPAGSPARARLFHPLTGPWARSCLRGLDGGPGAEADDPARTRTLHRDLAHFSAVAAVAAAVAGLPFATRLTARAGVLTLPSLGALHTADPGDVPVDVSHRDGVLTIRQHDAPDVRVHLANGTGAWSGAPAWTPAHTLPALLPAAAPVPLDDLDPYREPPYSSHRGSLSGVATLDDAERKRWLQGWHGTAVALRSGGAHRLTEAAALLRCLVPLKMPPEAGTGRGSCSATRREAFGALLSSTPPDPVTFAATLVHELQHAKLAALGDLVTLHRAGPEPRYFAPWRPDPRPYDGLLQGTYSHLALAAFHQRRALLGRPPERAWAWSQHARYHAQVGAALPALVGSPDLTPPGRLFVDEMAATYQRMADHPAPRDHTARAQAYVASARALWTRRHAPALPLPNE